MNLTICGKTNKVIRHWEKQCFPCFHAKIVMRRDLINGQKTIHLGLFLYGCPHVVNKFKLIGKNTHRDRPRNQTLLIPISTGLYSPCPFDATLTWEEIPPQDSTEKIWIAIIPRQILKREFGLSIPLNPEPCPICQTTFSPGVNAMTLS